MFCPTLIQHVHILCFDLAKSLTVESPLLSSLVLVSYGRYNILLSCSYIEGILVFCALSYYHHTLSSFPLSLVPFCICNVPFVAVIFELWLVLCLNNRYSSVFSLFDP